MWKRLWTSDRLLFIRLFSSLFLKKFLTVFDCKSRWIFSLMLRPKEKCALNVNLSLRVWACVHARTGLCIYEGVTVFLCFNVCCFYCIFFSLRCCCCCWCINHDVTAARMFVPVWGHLTNTMNVDIISLFFFLPKVLSLGLFCFSAVVSSVTSLVTD